VVEKLIAKLNREFAKLKFSVPWVYNPWEYAQEAYLDYWRRYGQGHKEFMLLGMNPGPWGMAQTGIPFGEVVLARDWLGIRGKIGKPKVEHPKRPIQGWDCPRSEVSGRRLWGYLKERFPDPKDFFAKAYVANYCPLVFMEESGANVTPDKLPKAERAPLLEICDQFLAAHLEQMQPKKLVGVGKWAEKQGKTLVDKLGLDIEVTSIPHPSPANPGANKGWGNELGALL
jgi:single-strand selective monofunctional uracil DNA glycosylase